MMIINQEMFIIIENRSFTEKKCLFHQEERKIKDRMKESHSLSSVANDGVAFNFIPDYSLIA